MDEKDKRLLARIFVGAYSLLPDAGQRIMVRSRNGIIPVALVTKEDKDWIKSRTTNRKLVKGAKLDLDGDGIDSVQDLMDEGALWDMDVESFEEYLDWLDPDADRIRECAPFPDTGRLILTCRDSFSKEDDPDNFTWLLPKDYRKSDEFQDLKSDINDAKGQFEDKKNKVEELKVKNSKLERELRGEEEEKEEVNSRIEELESEIKDLRGKNRLYEKVVAPSLAEDIKSEAEEEALMEKAEDIGRYEGEGPIGKVTSLLGEISDLEDRKSEVENETELSREIRELKSELGSTLDELGQRVNEVEESIEEVKSGGA